MASVEQQTTSLAVDKDSHRMIKWIQLLAQQVITTALDLVFPPLCVNCERVGSFLCEHCRAAIQPARPREVAGLDTVFVRAEFSGVMSTAIHAFKYKNQRRLVTALGALLGECLPVTWLDVDLVTAVPMHSSRLAERGYNQAALLAGWAAEMHAWPFVPQAVERIRATPSQVNLTAQERRTNVADAFQADAAWVQGRRILLIDDVLTTGATLAACAEALRNAGATAVWAAAVASAVDPGLVRDASVNETHLSV